MTGTFKGRLTAVYIESNGGRTVNVLSRTEKEARLGILYNRHGPVYYLPTHHEIVAIFVSPQPWVPVHITILLR